MLSFVTFLILAYTHFLQASGSEVHRSIHAKLMLVDLAGSERVRRTTSKGNFGKKKKL